MYVQEILGATAVNTEGFALLVITVILEAEISNQKANILCHWLIAGSLTSVSSLEMWNTSDILIASVSRQKASEGTKEGWSLTLGFGQKKCTSVCMITHMHSSFASNVFFTIFQPLPLLCISGISVSIIVFSCTPLVKLKIILFLQWGFLVKNCTGQFLHKTHQSKALRNSQE